jgi:hypothetical protein
MHLCSKAQTRVSNCRMLGPVSAMMLLFLMVFLLVGALGSLLGWSPKTRWSYAPTAVCSVLAVVLALAIWWSPP